jgi:RNA polymerase sigma-70 factor (ECF subfamily)
VARRTPSKRLPRFQFRCSVRAWVFTLARNAGSRYLEREVKKQRAQLPLSGVPELAAPLQSLRTRTLAHLRTENRERVAQIRAQLSEVDQLLLTLRVDRELSFREIALVMLEDVDAADGTVTREEARLRKRFQLVKDKLRRLLASSTT